MYEIVLLIHSWLRWVVVFAGVASFAFALRGLVAGAEFTRTQRISGIAFLASTHTMLVLGLVLLFALSPVTQIALTNMENAMGDTLLRFWTVEHTTLMVLAVVAITVGYSTSKRAVESVAKHRRALVGFGLGIVFISLGLPWPWREIVGRSWFPI